MLKLLRQGGVTKAAMGAVVILIIAAFAFDYRTAGVAGGRECVVEVERECVEVGDYNALIRLVAPQGATNKQLRESGLMKYALDALVERELLLQEAERLGVSISEDELDDLLAAGQVHFSWPADAPVPSALAAGRPFPLTGASPTVTFLRVRNSKTKQFDYNIYRRQVQNLLRMSPRHFKETQEGEVVAARVRQMVTSPVRVSEQEVFREFERQRSKATARVVEAKFPWFERFAVDVTDDQARSYAESHAEDIEGGWSMEQAKWSADCPLVSEILISYPPGADEDGKAQAADKAKQAAGLLKDGVLFTHVAKMYSSGRTASAGGELGCLTEDYGPSAAELIHAVEATPQGKVTEVLESPRGQHIFLFHGKLDEQAAKERGRLALARRLASQAAAEEKAKQFADELLQQVKGTKDLKAATEQLVPKYVTLPVDEAVQQRLVALATEFKGAPAMEVSRTFSRNASPIFGVKGGVDAAALVFALESPDDFVAEPIETHTAFAVLQLKEKTLASREDFEKEKVELMRAAQEQKRSAVLTQYVQRLREAAKVIKINPQYVGGAGDEEQTKESSTEESSG